MAATAAHPPIDWGLYRSFIAVMRCGSLSGAARSLGLSQPSVGRHIDALEQSLGLALFTRASDGLRPTPRAKALLAAVEPMQAAADHALRVARSDEAMQRATIRVTASQIMGVEVLPALLARYQTRHPHITIEVSVSNAQEDLLKHEADIAVRMVRPTQQGLMARKLARVGLGLYAHRQHIQSHGMPRSLADLAHHPMIGFDRDAEAARLVQSMVTPLGLALSRDVFSFRADNDLVQLATLRAGAGIGGCQHAIARRDINLVPVLPDVFNHMMEMWLVAHADLRKQPAVMGLYRFLAAELPAWYAEAP
jgi:DNA-binding transcriptional LysR family regulator